MSRTTRTIKIATVLCLLAFNALGQDASTENLATSRLQSLMDIYWSYRLAESPTLATAAGMNDYNHLLPQVAPLDRSRRLRAEQDFLLQLGDIDRTNLNLENKINYDLLGWVLEISIESMELNTERIPFNTFSSFFTGALRASYGVSMTTEEDYRAYTSRIREFPRYFAENIENMREGMRSGFVLPKVIIDGVLPTVRAQVYDNPDNSSLFEPIAEVSDRLSAAVQEQIRLETREAIRLYAIPAFRELAEFLQNEYYPMATEGIAAQDLPNGDAFYTHQIKVYTTRTDLSAEQIHNIGVSEVARIRREMEEVIAASGFDGSFEEFTEFLRAEPRFYANDETALLKLSLIHI